MLTNLFCRHWVFVPLLDSFVEHLNRLSESSCCSFLVAAFFGLLVRPLTVVSIGSKLILVQFVKNGWTKILTFNCCIFRYVIDIKEKIEITRMYHPPREEVFFASL